MRVPRNKISNPAARVAGQSVLGAAASRKAVASCKPADALVVVYEYVIKLRQFLFRFIIKHALSDCRQCFARGRRF